MEVRTYLIFVLVGVFSYAAIQDCSLEAMSVADVERLALEHNPELLQKQQQARIAFFQKENARSLRWPVLKLDSRIRAPASVENPVSYVASMGIGATWSLFQGGYLTHQRRLGEQVLHRAGLERRMTRIELRKRLLYQLAEWFFQRNVLEYQNRDIEVKKQSLRLVSLKYDAGEEFHWALKSAQIDLDQKKLDLEKAKESESQLRKTIAKIIGVQGADVDLLNVIESTWPPLNQKFFNSNIDAMDSKYLVHLAKLQSELQSEKIDIESKKSSFFPKVRMAALLGFADTSNQAPKVFPQFSANFSMPLYEGGRLRRQVKIGFLKKQMIESKLRNESTNVRDEFQSKQKELNQMQREKALSVRRNEVLKDQLRIAEAQYEMGQISYDVFSRAQHEASVNQRHLFDFDRRLRFIQLDLEAQLGKELANDA